MNELVNGEPTTTENIAQSMIPYFTDGTKKAKYLSYLISNFSVMESCKLAKVHYTTILNWRKIDPQFVEVENSIPKLRKDLANNLVDIEFTRNFRLILAKDFEILFKDAQGLALTDKEQQYLLTIRKFYTPQQFAMIKQLVGGNGKSEEAFDFTRTVLTLRIEKEEGTRIER